METDQYGESVICNLYYDTPSYDLIRSSLEKPVYKEKLRLRSYGVPGREDNTFIEIKKKYDGITSKDDLEVISGTLMITAADDGIVGKDSIYSNGAVRIDAGEFQIASGDDGINVAGGNLYVAGSNGMAKITSSSSSQASVSAGFTSTVSGGTRVSVSDSSGNIVYSFTPVKDFGMVCISGAEISTSETYT